MLECYGGEQYNGDDLALSLFNMAEYFRTLQPAKYKMAIKCIQACFKFSLSRPMTGHVHFELGKLLFHYTNNIHLAKEHLEEAFQCFKEFGLLMNRVESACLLSEMYIQLKLYEPVKQLLKQEASFSFDFPHLHAWLLFLLAEVYGLLDDWNNAIAILDAGISSFAQINDTALECFFRLSKSMVISMDLNRGQDLIENIMKSSDMILQIGADHPCINSLKAYCFAIQICYFISIGMISRSKSCLHQLQSLVQLMKFTYDDESEYWPGFEWMGRETISALTYVLTVIQSLQNGQMERAQKYHGTALRHINDMRRLMLKSNWPIVRQKTLDALSAFEIILLENIATAHLMLAKPWEAINVLGFMMNKMRENVHLFSHFESQLHALLGMYCWSIRLNDNAEMQFQAALRTAKDMDTWTVVNLSLAIVYLLTCREADFYSLFERIIPGKLHSSSPLLKASAHFVHALHSYLHSRFQEAKSHLTDSVTIVRNEGVPRIQALATLLSAKLVGPETADIMTVANTWTAKSSDHSLSLWANCMTYAVQVHMKLFDDAHNMKEKIEQMQHRISENMQNALNCSFHSLAQWESGTGW